MTITLSNDLPAYPTFTEGIRRAPDRGYRLTPAQTETALRNALRYIPVELHEQLAPGIDGRITYQGQNIRYRFRPEGDLKAKPIDEYKGNCIEGKAFQVMIDNNLSFDIALYPYELVTYGETGQVCQNWMQYRLIKQYLEIMTNEQTLVVESGHPLGLFQSHPEAPRVIITKFHDGRHVRQPERLGNSRTDGSSQLWTNDRRRLDVHRSARHCTRHVQHPIKCRPHEIRSTSER